MKGEKMMMQNPGRYDEFVGHGQNGSSAAVDTLMAALLMPGDFATCKLADYALGLVERREGVARIRYYLFHGEPQQRNYAALYFKRRGWQDVLDEAFAQGLVDWPQAFAR